MKNDIKGNWMPHPDFSANAGSSYATPKIAPNNQDPKIPFQSSEYRPLKPVSVSKKVSNFTK